MNRNIVAAAMAAILAGCVSPPPGFDRAKWHKDRNECIKQAKEEAIMTASLGDRLESAGHFNWGPGAELFALPATNKLSSKWLDARSDQCMADRGYPPE